MVGNTEQATPAEKARMEKIKVLGCVACVISGWPDMQCEVHHVVEGRVRLGHDQTMGLCLWHHRAETSDGYTKQQMSGLLGPSLANGSYDFAENFGSQATLVQVQNYIIDRFAEAPWLEFSMPRGIILDIFQFWARVRKANESL